ncbi:serine/threonine protein kinase [Bacillus infantis]|uniref:serine/threonine protein kinase n=1 Tax=Bacillus infantis TaxID=324767 RepID=UPI0021554D28|nr:serine/threonine protein kinase [Bacillus infantis]MCR6610619.1 serine/threonine protein kinase [Bacillus infantis]
MKDEFRNEQLPKWEEMIKTLFKREVPLENEWLDRGSINKVLDYIGTSQALNHTFLPKGGGLDLHGCVISNEPDCLELNLGSIAHVLKPKRLIFYRFEDADYEWAYFRLEADDLQSSGVYEELAFQEEELVEISPGEYIERAYWDAGEYYGQPLPKEARLIGRYLNGSFVIFSKASLYNANTSTYDGRHNTVKADGFKKYIQEVVTHLKEQE